jgi:hypothetical protein
MLFFVQVSLASDFMYNHLSKDVTASVGYDYNLRQVRHMQFGFDIFFSHVLLLNKFITNEIYILTSLLKYFSVELFSDFLHV